MKTIDDSPFKNEKMFKIDSNNENVTFNSDNSSVEAASS